MSVLLLCQGFSSVWASMSLLLQPLLPPVPKWGLAALGFFDYRTEKLFQGDGVLRCGLLFRIHERIVFDGEEAGADGCRVASLNML